MKYSLWSTFYFLLSICGPSVIALASDGSGASASTSQIREFESFPNAEALLSRIEAKYPAAVLRKNDKGVFGLQIPYEYVSDRNLSALGELKELTELKLFLAPACTGLTTNGVAALGKLKHLHSLSIQCSKVMPLGLFRAVCQLTNLASLTLNASYPPPEEYYEITNLICLKELRIYGDHMFNEALLRQLAGLPDLQGVEFSGADLRSDWTNIVANFPSLTNAVLYRDGEIVRWTRRCGNKGVK